MKKDDVLRLMVRLNVTQTFLVQFVNDPENPAHVSEAIKIFNENKKTVKEVKP